MTKKKTRTQSDQSGDPMLAFFEHILEESFSNPAYIAMPPAECYYSEFPEDEKGSWDPNSPAIFEHSRSPQWLKDTWEMYLRPKYKKALDKWNKQTGGGDGNPTEFINYSGGDRWLVWLFCKDLEANFLLAGNAAGRMPAHLQLEAGFDDQSLSATSETGSATKRSIEENIEATKRLRTDMKETLDIVKEHLKEKKVAAAAVAVDSSDQYL
jgi:hypothetical protein